jgi:hypothetical protein
LGKLPRFEYGHGDNDHEKICGPSVRHRQPSYSAPADSSSTVSACESGKAEEVEGPALEGAKPAPGHNEAGGAAMQLPALETYCARRGLSVPALSGIRATLGRINAACGGVPKILFGPRRLLPRAFNLPGHLTPLLGNLMP